VIQSLEELIVPGRVLRLFCSFTVPPKEKSGRLSLFPPPIDV
jgi:hypothetical protein